MRINIIVVISFCHQNSFSMNKVDVDNSMNNEMFYILKITCYNIIDLYFFKVVIFNGDFFPIAYCRVHTMP